MEATLGAPEASLFDSSLWRTPKLSVQPHRFLAHLLLLPPDPLHSHTKLTAQPLLWIWICKFMFSMGCVKWSHILFYKKIVRSLGHRACAQLGNPNRNEVAKQTEVGQGDGSQVEVTYFPLEKSGGLIPHPRQDWDIILPWEERAIIKVQTKHRFLEIVMFPSAWDKGKLSHGFRTHILGSTLPYTQGSKGVISVLCKVCLQGPEAACVLNPWKLCPAAWNHALDLVQPCYSG